MWKSKQYTNNRNSRTRMLRIESLEPRQLLAADLIGAPVFEKAVDPVVAEISQDHASNVLVHANDVQSKLVDRFDADAGRTPVQEIDVPTTIDTPAYGRNPGRFEVEDVLGMKWPLPPEFDPSTLPDDGCPAAPPSEGNRYWLNPGTDAAWRAQNHAYDVSCDPGSLELIPLDMDFEGRYSESLADATRRKIGGEWAPSSNRLSTDPLPRQSCEKGSDKDTDKNTDSNDSTEETIKEKPVEDESGGKPPVEKDPEPEGDDPDELRGALVDQAMAAYADAPTGWSPSGEREPGEDDPWARHRQEIGGNGIADPEEGGPDEMGSPVSSALNSALVGGENAHPANPDDPAPPPRPEVSPDATGTCAASAIVASRETLAGNDATPPVDDPDAPSPGPVFLT